MKDLADLRREYEHDGLSREDLSPSPFEQFADWFEAIGKTEIADANAMVLATSTPDTGPTQRTVLLKYFGVEGFVFFTNLGSRKAQHIQAQSRVSLLFPWREMERQVEINGAATRISSAEALKYFSRRPRNSQLGAWVSHQSTVISSRAILENKLVEMLHRFADSAVPLPKFWGGFRVVPDRFEFWQGQPSRLHDRFQYLPDGDGWSISRLSP